jgi:hypothetical protein
MHGNCPAHVSGHEGSYGMHICSVAVKGRWPGMATISIYLDVCAGHLITNILILPKGEKNNE